MIYPFIHYPLTIFRQKFLFKIYKDRFLTKTFLWIFHWNVFRSKLALSILAHHLNGKNGIHAISVHPGIVQTSLSKPISSKTKNLLHMIRFNRFTDTLVCSLLRSMNIMNFIQKDLLEPICRSNLFILFLRLLPFFQKLLRFLI